MKKFILIIAALFTVSLLNAQNKCDQVVGKWMVETKDSSIEIVKNSDGTYNGIIIWIEASKFKSKEGCDFIKNMVYVKDEGVWTTDYLYSPLHNMVAKGKLSIVDDKLIVRGKKFGISDSRKFTRIK